MFYRMPAAAPSFTSPPFLHLPLRHLSTVSPSSPPSPLYPLSIFLPPSPSFSPLLHLPPPFTIFLAPSPLPLEPHPHHLSSHVSQSLSEPPPPNLTQPIYHNLRTFLGNQSTAAQQSASNKQGFSPGTQVSPNEINISLKKHG